MLDIYAQAKVKLKGKSLAEVEAIIEYAIAGVAENYYARSKTKNWREAYNYAASFLAPKKGAELVLRRMKKEFPPILGVDSNANITELSRKYFQSLLKKKDPQAVIQALVNIKRWREDNEELSAWAGAMATSLVNEFNFSLGPQGECICPECNATQQKMAGVPCKDIACPECGKAMMRKESPVTKLFIPQEPNTESEKEEEDEEFDHEAIDVELDEGESPKPLEAQGTTCKCPECGYTATAYPDTPCSQMECPKCPGVMMQPIASSSPNLRALKRIKKKK